jgi:hypothetical protein
MQSPQSLLRGRRTSNCDAIEMEELEFVNLPHFFLLPHIHTSWTVHFRSYMLRNRQSVRRKFEEKKVRGKKNTAHELQMYISIEKMVLRNLSKN